jgi:hypothetical protein
MERIYNDRFDFDIKSALRRCKTAILTGAMLLALCSSAEVQRPKNVPRIGYLSTTNPSRDSTRSEAIRLALRELGHMEGQNIVIEYRSGSAGHLHPL